MILEMTLRQRKVKPFLRSKRLLQSGKITAKVVRNIARGLENRVPFAGSAERAGEILRDRELRKGPPQFAPARVIRTDSPQFAPFRIWRPNQSQDVAA